MERPGTQDALSKHELLLLTPTFLAPDFPVPGVPNEAGTFWKSGTHLTGPGMADSLILGCPGPALSRCFLPARAAGESGGCCHSCFQQTPPQRVFPTHPPPPPASPSMSSPVSSTRTAVGRGLGPPFPPRAHCTQICDFPWISTQFFQHRRSRGGTCFQDSLQNC